MADATTETQDEPVQTRVNALAEQLRDENDDNNNESQPQLGPQSVAYISLSDRICRPAAMMLQHNVMCTLPVMKF